MRQLRSRRLLSPKLSLNDRLEHEHTELHSQGSLTVLLIKDLTHWSLTPFRCTLLFQRSLATRTVGIYSD